MGLIRSSARATADGPHTSGPSDIVGAGTRWEAINDPFGPGTIRSVTMALYSDDLTDDTDYISLTAADSFVEFVFGNGTLYFNGDDLALVANVRVRTETAGAAQSLDVIRDHSTIAPDLITLGTITVPGDGAWHNERLIVSNNPITGLPWDISTLSIETPTTFGLSPTVSPSVAIHVSRFYLTTLTFPGPTVGRDYRQSNWRFCDVCGLKSPYEQIQRPFPPHPQAGLAVCPRCYDEPDHDTVKVMSRHLPRDYSDILY